jgi:hypothetical protein
VRIVISIKQRNLSLDNNNMKKFKTIVQYVTKYLNQNQKKRNLDGNGISTQAVTYVMIALRRKT